MNHIIIYFLTLYIITSITVQFNFFLRTEKYSITIPKKKSKFDIKNYCPVITLPVLSKIYEMCIFDQMYNYFNQILSKHQYRFRQGRNTQHSLLFIVEKMKKSLGNCVVGGLLLTDLSKGFDCLRHDLLIAKLTAYGFDQPSLWFIFSYLSDRTQRAKENNAYNSYTNINKVSTRFYIRSSSLYY